MRSFKVVFIAILLFFSVDFYSQDYALQIYGAIITMNGGTSGTPLYINIAQTNANAVTRDAATFGHIYSESQYNYLNIQTGAGTGAYLFPFGNGINQTGGELEKYVPVTFTKTAGTSDVYISTRATGIADDNTPVFESSAGVPISSMGSSFGGDATTSTINRWWHVNVPGGATADIAFSVNWSGEVSGCTNVTTSTWKPQSWSSGTWQAPVGPGTTGLASGVSTVSTGSISSFSPWVVSKASTPLPVELLDFSAACKEGKVSFSWSTATETNNDYFTVEHSTDGLTFAPVVKVNGSGNSSSFKKYDAVDLNPDAAVNYYRLTQTDYDGKFENFKVIAVSCDDMNYTSGSGSSSNSSNSSDENKFSVYPNPNDGTNVFVKFKGFKSDQSILVMLIDMLGQTVYTKITITDATGTALEAVDELSHLSAGVYTVVGSVRNDIYKQKLVLR